MHSASAGAEIDALDQIITASSPDVITCHKTTEAVINNRSYALQPHDITMHSIELECKVPVSFIRSNVVSSICQPHSNLWKIYFPGLPGLLIALKRPCSIDLKQNIKVEYQPYEQLSNTF